MLTLDVSGVIADARSLKKTAEIMPRLAPCRGPDRTTAPLL